jgi:hypothetical protein
MRGRLQLVDLINLLLLFWKNLPPFLVTHTLYLYKQAVFCCTVSTASNTAMLLYPDNKINTTFASDKFVVGLSNTSSLLTASGITFTIS